MFKLQKELFNMSKVKCQRTLRFFNFTETICHGGEEFNVKIPDKAKDNSKTCSLWYLRSFNTQALGTNLVEEKLFLITSFTWANRGTKISDNMLSTEQQDSSVNVAIKPNPD